MEFNILIGLQVDPSVDMLNSSTEPFPNPAYPFTRSALTSIQDPRWLTCVDRTNDKPRLDSGDLIGQAAGADTSFGISPPISHIQKRERFMSVPRHSRNALHPVREHTEREGVEGQGSGHHFVVTLPFVVPEEKYGGGRHSTMVQLGAVGPLTKEVLDISEGYVDWLREGSTGSSALPFSEALPSLDSKYHNKAIRQKGIKEVTCHVNA
jgi:hypothetical protein